MVDHSTYQFEYDDDEEENDPRQSSSFYAFSFIDFADDNEDTWSINSTTTPNTHIRDEMKTCVDTIHNCLNDFRAMNEHSAEIDEAVRPLLNELLDRIENSLANEQSDETKIIDMQIDPNLLNELLIKKLTVQEYLILLDRLIPNIYLKFSSKTGEELSNEILSLAEDIEHYRTILLTDHSNHFDGDNQDSSLLLLRNTQSNHSVISFLQQSTSMDMSLLVTNDLSNLTQSTVFTTSTQQAQQKSTTDEKPTDIGRSFRFFSCRSREICSISPKKKDPMREKFSMIILGPFLRTIFIKLDNMLQNSLHVNLLLTGIISRLAQYSQPLLRSLLLNHSLVLETNVKSLFQVRRKRESGMINHFLFRRFFQISNQNSKRCLKHSIISILSFNSHMKHCINERILPK